MSRVQADRQTPGQATTAATLDAIDQVTAPRCGHCQGLIPAGCVSDDWCGEGCQRAWTAGQRGARQLPHGWNDVVPPRPRDPVMARRLIGYDESARLVVPLGVARPMPLLAPADPRHDRVDVVYEDSDGNICVATGVPAEVPQVPALPAGARLRLAQVRVAAGSVGAGVVLADRPGVAQMPMPGIDREAINAAIRSAQQRLSGHFEQVGRAIRTLVEQMRPYLPDPPPADPMLAMIEAKRSRNTGPKQAQRAPRRIDPRRGR